MISEALELCVDCGRISQRLCMYIVGHGYVGLLGVRDGGGT